MNALEIKKIEQEIEEIEIICNKIKEEKVFIIDYNDLDDLITKYFNLEDRYDIIAYEECNNYMSKTFMVTNNTPDIWTQETLDSVWKKKEVHHFSTNTYLNQICQDGYIKPGKYIIDVNW